MLRKHTFTSIECARGVEKTPKIKVAEKSPDTKQSHTQL